MNAFNVHSLHCHHFPGAAPYIIWVTIHINPRWWQDLQMMQCGSPCLHARIHWGELHFNGSRMYATWLHLIESLHKRATTFPIPWAWNQWLSKGPAAKVAEFKQKHGAGWKDGHTEWLAACPHVLWQAIAQLLHGTGEMDSSAVTLLLAAQKSSLQQWPPRSCPRPLQELSPQTVTHLGWSPQPEEDSRRIYAWSPIPRGA